MFRPCIDLHEGRVKQIVGGSLRDVSDPQSSPKVNFASERSAEWYADLYRKDGLRGGHVIMLGPGNESAAKSALTAYPGGLQVGGGIHEGNAQAFLDAGASHVIVTSWVFREGRIDFDRLTTLRDRVGRSRLVLDLSCRIRDGRYWVVTDRWQRFTDMALESDALQGLADHCDEFLVHAVDVEGLCSGIDETLVAQLTDWAPIPTTYAGGAKSIQDLHRVRELSRGRIDLTIGSALDIFGGTGVRYEDAVAFNRERDASRM